MLVKATQLIEAMKRVVTFFIIKLEFSSSAPSAYVQLMSWEHLG